MALLAKLQEAWTFSASACRIAPHFVVTWVSINTTIAIITSAPNLPMFYAKPFLKYLTKVFKSYCKTEIDHCFMYSWGVLDGGTQTSHACLSEHELYSISVVSHRCPGSTEEGACVHAGAQL